MIPTLEDLLSKLKGSSVYSKLDATSGFHQLKLDPESSKLTAFITPFGRYVYKRLPFGISSAPEIYQKQMEVILSNIPNVLCYFDDVFVYSESESAHEKHLSDVFDALERANVKLNPDKCELRKTEIEFLGYTISKNGIKPDVSKINAIIEMAEPTNVTELRRILGMINFLGKHVPHLSTTLRPMTELLEKDRAWLWGDQQTSAFKKVKELLTNAPTLHFYDPTKPTTVSADSSSYGIGGVLLQEHSGVLRPIAYCSRTLTQCEKRYAQIEKELLATTWVCEKFHRYLVGLERFVIETDHKPLVPLINKKDLSESPIRCQRMLLRLLRFSAKAVWTPGKHLVVADCLSRSPTTTTTDTEIEELVNDIKEQVNSICAAWPVSMGFMNKLKSETNNDTTLQDVIMHTIEGWPDYKENCRLGARDYYAIRNELSVVDGILLKGETFVAPPSMRKDLLEEIHKGHQGISKCKERARSAVWWPRISQDIKDRVSSCQICLEKLPEQTNEPLMSSELPNRPFQQVGVDLCEVKGEKYVVLVDYYSRFIEISHLSSTTSAEVIARLKNIFSRHGIPDTVVSDNGPQFSSSEFKTFAENWTFKHITSSPTYPQCNGQAENAVKAAKSIIRQQDPFMALLVHHATPIPSLGYSPSELAFGRKLRTTLPTLSKNLDPKPIPRQIVNERHNKMKLDQSYYYNRQTRLLPPLKPGIKIAIRGNNGLITGGWNRPGTVVKEITPRSYILQMQDGTQLRRNRQQIRTFNPPKSPGEETPFVQRTAQTTPIPVPIQSPSPKDSPQTVPMIPTTPTSTPVKTKSGRVSRPPAKFKDYECNS